ncbi:uncharacterized protein SPSK_06447 [Sporothrix schenckii 1099-18]|uniref:Uncharacterized protein n=1 Tax=Sporothrix schenckii 1099-18 TaxID=1397361 RepID=A0A0F2MIM1_SPOSC|nr:uncharacterized protein SPSK_06447 [Sporothrix schenckii 1099-18]KJR89543.1 hypothetical protein SPSK_06447 [Sporothrix schenckii 1099-18]
MANGIRHSFPRNLHSITAINRPAPIRLFTAPAFSAAGAKRDGTRLLTHPANLCPFWASSVEESKEHPCDNGQEHCKASKVSARRLLHVGVKATEPQEESDVREEARVKKMGSLGRRQGQEDKLSDLPALVPLFVSRNPVRQPMDWTGRPVPQEPRTTGLYPAEKQRRERLGLAAQARQGPCPSSNQVRWQLSLNELVLGYSISGHLTVLACFAFHLDRVVLPSCPAFPIETDRSVPADIPSFGRATSHSNVYAPTATRPSQTAPRLQARRFDGHWPQCCRLGSSCEPCPVRSVAVVILPFFRPVIVASHPRTDQGLYLVVFTYGTSGSLFQLARHYGWAVYNK